MIEITIYQKDSNAHTKFLIFDDGQVFAAGNFAIAKEWRDQGLLGEKASLLIDRIVDRQTAGNHKGALQIEL